MWIWEETDMSIGRLLPLCPAPMICVCLSGECVCQVCVFVRWVCVCQVCVCQVSVCLSGECVFVCVFVWCVCVSGVPCAQAGGRGWCARVGRVCCSGLAVCLRAVAGRGACAGQRCVALPGSGALRALCSGPVARDVPCTAGEALRG